MNDFEKMVEAYESSGGQPEAFKDSDVAHLVVAENRVLGAHLVPGLNMDVEETEKGIRALLVVEEGAKIKKPVHLCFGVLPEEGIQRIEMRVEVKDGGSVSVTAHCVFPNAVKVKHLMDAEIVVGNNARYEYRETHFHGNFGGVEVIPRAKIVLGENSALKSFFGLPKGRAGVVDIDYDAEVGANSVMELLARVNGYGNDRIKIREAGCLKGDGSRGLLESKIALKDEARAEVFNEIVALGAKAWGHVDCTEIIRDRAFAKAVPVVDVRHPEARVTHEAAIGGVNKTQLETLMARGLSEEEATEMIVQGLLQG
ncbi:MAG TPA: SufBD protein [Peptococcaceae bacterium]|nr:MAG: SufBD protein [Clostridia bacterium 41_269]HBT20187.1 SufBD protein [Peptococcaceae bacterium]